MQEVLVSLIDPRGRCNRKGLLVTALVLLAAEIVMAGTVWLAGFPVDHPALLIAKAALLWIAVAAASQRLHDLGRSAWSILWAMLALFVWSFASALTATIVLGPDEIVPGTPGFWLIFAAIAAPMLTVLFWLHFAPGQAQPNRYGPQPSGLGFSRPQQHSHRAPDGALAA